MSEIHSVEIIGGSSTNIPGIQDVISRVFGKNCCTTLNTDEAISKGCALQCLIKSTSFTSNVWNYTSSSILLYPISFSWEMESSEIT